MLFLALCYGLTYASLSNHICIFLPDLSPSPYIFSSHKHPLYPLTPPALPLCSLGNKPIHTTMATPTFIAITILLRAKDPKVRRARVCETVAGLVLQETQVTNAAPWLL